MHFHFLKFLVISLTVTVFAACGDKQEVTVQKSGKRHMGQQSAEVSRGGISWTTPAGWVEQTAGQMRLATYMVADKENQANTAEAMVVLLGGDGGGLVANVNRWRGQVGLKPVSAGEIKKSSQSTKGKAGQVLWFRIINKKMNRGILVSIIPLPNRTAFVKLIGHADVLSKNEEKFLELSKSVEGVSQKGHDHP